MAQQSEKKRTYKHKHGTWRRYHYEGCRCKKCRFAFNKDRAEKNGTSYCIDAREVKEHLDDLVRSGISVAMIAAKSGMSLNHLKRIRNGTTATVYIETHEELISISPDMFSTRAPSLRVSADGSMRRLRALAAVGWSTSTIHHATKKSSPSELSKIRSRKKTLIMPETAQVIADIYAELWNLKPRGAQRTIYGVIHQAREQGWHPPMAYDDHELDLPWGRAACEKASHLENYGS